MAKNKVRLDVLLTDKGLFPSREKARAAIMAGEVLVNENKIDKAGAQVDAQASIRLVGKQLPYVSRGGLKLEKAIQCFHLNLQGKTIIDIGASTGGFVDCALQNGATKVYAVDVGYNQLAWKLRNDSRVICLEKINARYLDRSIIDENVDMLTADVSFISLTLVLPPAIIHHLKPNGEIAVLIKPQFEAGREAVGKGGIVKDRAVHQRVIEKIFSACQEWGLSVQGLDYSPITGADGNIEYLLYGVKADIPPAKIDVDAVVESAWFAHKGEKEAEQNNE